MRSTRPLRTLVVDDGSALADTITSRLNPQLVSAARILIADTDGPTVLDRCRDVDAVAFVSAGWDAGLAASHDAALQHVLSALGGSGKRLLYLSDSTVIGDTKDSFGNEDSPRSTHSPHPWRCSAEAKVMRAIDTGVHSVVIRPALVHGRGAGSLVVGLVEHAQRWDESVFVGEGAATTSTIHVDDLTLLIQTALLRAPEGATYAAASEEVLTWKQIAELVARSANPKAELRSISVDDADRLGLDGPVMAVHNVVRDTGAQRRLGWVPQAPTLVDGLTQGLESVFIPVAS